MSEDCGITQRQALYVTAMEKFFRENDTFPTHIALSNILGVRESPVRDMLNRLEAKEILERNALNKLKRGPRWQSALTESGEQLGIVA